MCVSPFEYPDPGLIDGRILMRQCSNYYSLKTRNSKTSTIVYIEVIKGKKSKTNVE